MEIEYGVYGDLFPRLGPRQDSISPAERTAALLKNHAPQMRQFNTITISIDAILRAGYKPETAKYMVCK